ncbi:MAG: cobalamin-binding protein [Gammaproteobacteria bacterium]|jgi:iron complex transport system substrate-binding protein
MNLRVVKFVLVFLLLVCPAIVIARPAQRIVALAPNLTEIVFAVGAGKKLVGVSCFSDYPKAAKKIPVVAACNDLDIEKIISLHPDLVLAWQGGNPSEQINQLRKLGITVYAASFDKVTDIPKNILAIGKLVGTQTTAGKVSNKFMQNYLKLKNNYANKKPIKVFYELSWQPLLTLNKKSMVGQVINLCGGKNIFAETSIIAPRVGLASVLAADPQLILVSKQAGFGDLAVKGWDDYPQLNAVKNHHVFTVDSVTLERPGPRILQAAQQVCVAVDMVRKKNNL